MSWQQMHPRKTNSEENPYKYDSMATLPGQKIYPETNSSSGWRPIPLIISLLLWVAGLLFTLMLVGIILSRPATMISTAGDPNSPPHMVTQNAVGPGELYLILVAAFLVFSLILLIINILLYKRR